MNFSRDINELNIGINDFKKDIGGPENNVSLKSVSLKSGSTYSYKYIVYISSITNIAICGMSIYMLINIRNINNIGNNLEKKMNTIIDNSSFLNNNTELISYIDKIPIIIDAICNTIQC